MASKHSEEYQPKHSFTVQGSIADKIFLPAFSLLFELCCIAGAIVLDTGSSSRTMAIVFGIIGALTLLPLSLVSLMHRIEVNGTDLMVRTGIRKKTFTCTDITKLDCYEYRYKGGTGHAINIFTDSSKLCTAAANSKEKEFSQLAGYLLEQLDKGNIAEAAVSADCMEKLKRYAERRI